ncbi:MAG TPA: hypothetical protein DGH68_10425 [Bacteroidetes bacterium]|nr:hypothetical protein [Bacteroidota bacterium]
MTRLRVIGFVLIAGAALLCGFKILYDDGIVGQTKKPLNTSTPNFLVKGCFCHGDSASMRVRVWISGPETLAAGRQAVFTINVAKDSSIAAGFDVAAFYGDLGVADSMHTQLMRIEPFNPVDSLELTHTQPRLAAGRDTVSWSFWYRAPSLFGVMDTIYANGNSVDTSFDPSGDYWNFAPKFLVRIVNPTNVLEGHVAQAFRLAQNYPNPFNPSTVINFEMPAAGQVSLAAYDMSGRKASQLVDGYLGAGVHEVVFGRGESSPLASGVYLYRLIVRSPNAGSFVATRKMLLLK